VNPSNDPLRAWVQTLEPRRFLSVAIRLDYSLDASGFFTAHPEARTVLQTAADTLTRRLADTLAAITPGGVNTWTLVVTDPATGGDHDFTNLTIPADTIVVYAGSRPLGGPLGIGGPAGWSASGTSSFLNSVATRGEPGAQGTPEQRTDFAPAAGAITFEPTRNWNFDLAAPHSGADDFLSVSLHELGHVLGIGTADSWYNQVSGTLFNGAASIAAYGQSVPLASDAAHWAQSVTSDGQVAAMTPSITVGTRKQFTRLDFAGLFDVGWEPAATVVSHVSAAYVAGSQWSQSFKAALAAQGLGSATYGFALPAAPAAPLPWVNVNQVSIAFDRDVTVDQTDLVVTGTRGTLPTTTFAYNGTTHTATWTFPAALTADRVTLTLPAATADPTLDGDGNGTPGGDFVRRFNVLPGDVNGSGTVLADDYSQVKQKFFSSTASPGSGAAAYSVFHDVNGSGSILADDFSEVKKRFFDVLPGVVAGTQGAESAAALPTLRVGRYAAA
jgi:hypothetical protein